MTHEVPADTMCAVTPQPDLTSVVVPLLKDVLYREKDAAKWAGLIQLQPRVRDCVAVMAHTGHWGREPLPVLRELPRLDTKEHALFDDLRHRRLGSTPGSKRVRLEQERFGFGWVQRAVSALLSLGQSTRAAP